jgi:hypothetical protein
MVAYAPVADPALILNMGCGNSPPPGEDGEALKSGGKKRGLGSRQHKAQAKPRKEKRDTLMDGHASIIFKMPRDMEPTETCAYARHCGCNGDALALLSCMETAGKNSFPGQKAQNPMHFMRCRHPAALWRRIASPRLNASPPAMERRL